VGLNRRPDLGVGEHLGLIGQLGRIVLVELVQGAHLGTEVDRIRNVLGDQLQEFPGPLDRVGAAQHRVAVQLDRRDERIRLVGGVPHQRPAVSIVGETCPTQSLSHVGAVGQRPGDFGRLHLMAIGVTDFRRTVHRTEQLHQCVGVLVVKYRQRSLHEIWSERHKPRECTVDVPDRQRATDQEATGPRHRVIVHVDDLDHLAGAKIAKLDRARTGRFDLEHCAVDQHPLLSEKHLVVGESR